MILQFGKAHGRWRISAARDISLRQRWELKHSPPTRASPTQVSWCWLLVGSSAGLFSARRSSPSQEWSAQLDWASCYGSLTVAELCTSPWLAPSTKGTRVSSKPAPGHLCYILLVKEDHGTRPYLRRGDCTAQDVTTIAVVQWDPQSAGYDSG